MMSIPDDQGERPNLPGHPLRRARGGTGMRAPIPTYRNTTYGAPVPSNDITAFESDLPSARPGPRQALVRPSSPRDPSVVSCLLSPVWMHPRMGLAHAFLFSSRSSPAAANRSAWLPRDEKVDRGEPGLVCASPRLRKAHASRHRHGPCTTAQRPNDGWEMRAKRPMPGQE